MFLAIALFLYIYSPPIRGVPIGTDKLAGILIVMTALVRYRRKLIDYIVKGMARNNLSMALLLIGATIALLYDIANDRGISAARSYQLFAIILEVVPVAFVFALFFAHNGPGDRDGNSFRDDRFLNTMLIIGSAQALLCILMLANEDIRDFILTRFLRLGQEHELRDLFAVRGYGVGTSYFFSYPLFQALLVAICVAKLFRNIWYVILLPVLLIPVALNARIGYIAIPACAAASLWVIIINGPKGAGWIIRLGIRLCCIGTLLVFVGMVVLSSADVDSKLLQWNLRIAKDLTASGGEQTDMAVLSQMVILPKLEHAIVGTGIYCFDNIDRSYRSDIGYINDLMLGGVVFVIAIYGAIALFVMRALHGELRMESKILIWSCAWIAVIGNCKGIVVSNEPFLRGFMIIMLYYECQRRGHSARSGSKRVRYVDHGKTMSLRDRKERCLST